MEEKDIYVVIDRQKKGDYYLCDYDRTGQVAVSELYRDAIKFEKDEAERVSDLFGMMSLKVNVIS